MVASLRSQLCPTVDILLNWANLAFKLCQNQFIVNIYNPCNFHIKSCSICRVPFLKHSHTRLPLAAAAEFYFCGTFSRLFQFLMFYKLRNRFLRLT